MSVIDSLEKQGIKVKVQIPRIIRESDNPDSLDTVKKYNKTDNIHWSDWRNVQFAVKDREEAEKVSFARRYLGINGCSFDTGSGCGSMDWEIDWSFHFTGQEESKERADFDEVMEEFCLEHINDPYGNFKPMCGLLDEQNLDCPYDCTMGKCDCKPKTN